MTVLLQQVEVGGAVLDVRIGERVLEVGELRRTAGEVVVDGQRGALLPGLHDHHLHLMALAASRESVDVAEGLAALRNQPGTDWIRGVGLAADVDREGLDAIVADRPVRVQHRSGALWVLNTAAVRALHLDDSDHPGVERDEAGRATGRLWRADDLLAQRLGRRTPDLAGLATELATLGLTGLTDATPDLDAATTTLLRQAFPQRLQLLGDPAADGPWKVVIPDHDLPSLDEVEARLRAARPRPVAVHCVTREALALTLAALDVVGRHPADRIEHGAVLPMELAGELPALVTQPGFIAARGDDYLRDVEPHDQADLYRYRSPLAAGCPVVASSDAPFGPLDPWEVLRAARDRRTPSGTVLGPDERVDVRTALDGLLRPLEDLRAAARRVAPGVPADLVLLHGPLAAALEEPDAGRVRATFIGGRVVAGEHALA